MGWLPGNPIQHLFLRFGNSQGTGSHTLDTYMPCLASVWITRNNTAPRGW
jgi:hypothetical protein